MAKATGSSLTAVAQRDKAVGGVTFRSGLCRLVPLRPSGHGRTLGKELSQAFSNFFGQVLSPPLYRSQSHGLDLYQGSFRQGPYLDCGTSRIRFLKVLRINLIHCRKLGKIGHKYSGFDHMFEFQSDFGQNSFQIFQTLTGLFCNRSLDQLPGLPDCRDRRLPGRSPAELHASAASFKVLLFATDWLRATVLGSALGPLS